MNFDHLVVAHEKDFNTLPLCVEGLGHIKGGTGKIYVISKKDPGIDGVEFVDERSFDKHFSLSEVRDALRARDPYAGNRSGWIYQQMLKMLCWKEIDFTNGRYHSVDADVIYVRDVDYGGSDFTYSRPYNGLGGGFIYFHQYNDTFKNLIGRSYGKSYVCHNMVFDKRYLSELIGIIEDKKGKDFVLCLYDSIHIDEYGPAFSEYELYGNWMVENHPDKCKEIDVKWMDFMVVPNEDLKRELISEGFDFVASHEYMRQELPA